MYRFLVPNHPTVWHRRFGWLKPIRQAHFEGQRLIALGRWSFPFHSQMRGSPIYRRTILCQHKMLCMLPKLAPYLLAIVSLVPWIPSWPIFLPASYSHQLFCCPFPTAWLLKTCRLFFKSCSNVVAKVLFWLLSNASAFEQPYHDLVWVNGSDL